MKTAFNSLRGGVCVLIAGQRLRLRQHRIKRRALVKLAPAHNRLNCTLIVKASCSSAKAGDAIGIGLRMPEVITAYSP
jgi:hypothetical protein